MISLTGVDGRLRLKQLTVSGSASDMSEANPARTLPTDMFMSSRARASGWRGDHPIFPSNPMSVRGMSNGGIDTEVCPPSSSEYRGAPLPSKAMAFMSAVMLMLSGSET